MYLEKLELQGFKSFAPKTHLEFLLPKDGKCGITAIVGPNGSGKSNLSDSLRWVLGEQSMKVIRGKKSEDVIFSGTDKKTRSGFAEVSLFLNNEEQKTNSPYSEIVLTRRLYRNGDSEYLLNKKRAKLSDIHLLTAKSNIGSRSYSIIGQGTIDKILTLSDEERKDFFNEATGIKQYQIKKDQSINKLARTKNNLEQTEIVLQEIEPHLKSLKRQAKKLEEREEIEATLKELEYKYYGSLWQNFSKNIDELTLKVEDIEEKWQEKRKEITAIQKEFQKLEKEKPSSLTFLELQSGYQKLLEEKNKLREKEWELRNLIASEESKNQSKTISISMRKIAESIEVISTDQKKIIENLKSAVSNNNLQEVKEIISDFEVIDNKTSQLLQKIIGEPEKISTKLPDLLKSLEVLKKENENFERKIIKIKEEINSLASKENEEKNIFFEKQRKLEVRQNEIFSLETELNNLKIDLARFETKREGLEEEMGLEMNDRIKDIKKGLELTDADKKEILENKEEIFNKIQRLKNHIDLIGGIDPETPKEFKEINDRYEFLNNESHDLKSSIQSLESVIKELNKIIENQFNSSFSKINEYFDRYFKILFSGGSAKIIKVDNLINKDDEDEDNFKNKKIKDYNIEIHAIPPGKKIKNLEVLSGGEKALTAIALLCAIMANNPSPFVILDEVDAALDEANSIKFADILYELSEKTQFVVITHNRATMEKASVLYGITMEDKGISKLLSMKLEDTKKISNS